MDNTIIVDNIRNLELGNTFSIHGLYKPRKWWKFWESKKIRQFRIESLSKELITYKEID